MEVLTAFDLWGITCLLLHVSFERQPASCPAAVDGGSAVVDAVTLRGGDSVDEGLTDHFGRRRCCGRTARRRAGTVVVCLVGLLGLWALAASPALAVKAPTGAQVQSALNELVAAGAPAVTAVIRGPRSVERYSAGLANVRAGTPVSTADHFRIGSVTKTFVATTVLRLVAQAKLSLSDTVQRWLPGLIPNGSQITIRELLNHSSGIADYCSLPNYPTVCSPRGSAMTKPWTQQQLVQLGASAAPTFPPGQGWAYSNTGYVLLGMIIARVTGHTLTEELQRQIYRPLGLRQTSFATTTAVPRPYSHGYDVAANGSWPLDLTKTTPTIAWGAGAMVSTLGNLTTFMQALMGARLFTRPLLRQMQAPTPLSLTGSQHSLGPQFGSYGFGLIHFTWAAACGVYGNTGDFPGYGTVAMATAGGARGAALSITSDTLTSAGQLGYIKVERLVGCRMRFGSIGHRHRAARRHARPTTG